MTRLFTRAPFLVLALASMTWGIWMGLLRLGWALPLPWPDQLILHGPLMIGGFLGTVIGLERAIGIARTWAYAAPLLTAVGSVMLVLGPPGPSGALLITAGSAVVVGVFVVVVSRQSSFFAWTMTAGAAAWFVGNMRWLAGFSIYQLVWWWIGFAVLTIAGERLELNRLLRPRANVRVSFAAAVGLLAVGVGTTTVRPEWGTRVAGAGLVLLAGWLGTYDLARRTVRQSGVTRFTAICLLLGYGWLGVAGGVAAITGAAEPGAPYDAVLHAVFLGFVVSMIFGHAPIVFPAVTGKRLPYRAGWYGHVAVLHASVAMRLVGDFIPELARWRVWSGIVSAAAIAAFALNTIAATQHRLAD